MMHNARDTIVDLTQQLVQINSANPHLAPRSLGEATIADFVARWLTYAGLKVYLEAVLPGRQNVVGVAAGRGGGRTLLLHAHMDCAAGGEMSPESSQSRRDGRLYGRGASDMKGGLAVNMCVAAVAAQQAWRGDVVVAGVIDEEYASAGAHALINRWHADAAIVTEATDLDICIEHPGTISLEIETRRSPPNVSRTTSDARAMMRDVILALRESGEVVRTTYTHQSYLGHIYQVALDASDGRQFSPDMCRLNVKRRIVAGERSGEIAQDVQRVITHAKRAHMGCEASVRVLASRDPFLADMSATIVPILRESATAVCADPPLLVSMPIWTDAAILASVGIPTLLFGPVGGGMHKAAEWVEISSLYRCFDAILGAARIFCD